MKNKMGRDFTKVNGFAIDAPPISVRTVSSVPAAKAEMKLLGAAAFTYFPKVATQNVMYFSSIPTKQMKYNQSAITYLSPYEDSKAVGVPSVKNGKYATGGCVKINDFTFGVQPISIRTVRSLSAAKAQMTYLGAVSFTYYPNLSTQNVKYFGSTPTNCMKYDQNATTYTTVQKEEIFGVPNYVPPVVKKPRSLYVPLPAPRKKVKLDIDLLVARTKSKPDIDRLLVARKKTGCQLCLEKHFKTVKTAA